MMDNFYDLLGNIKSKFYATHHFEQKNGYYYHAELDQKILPLTSNDLVLSFKDDLFDKGESPLLGVYYFKSYQKHSLVLFSDAIDRISDEYSDFKSKKYVNGKEVDSRQMLGFVLQDGTGIPGLHFGEARKRVETIVKLQLSLYRLVHTELGNWKSDFFSEENYKYINTIVDSLTISVLNEEMLDCYWYIKTIGSNKLNFDLINPVLFAKLALSLNSQDWKIIENIKEFINDIPDKLLKEFILLNNHVSFDKFIQDNKESLQQGFIKRALKDKSKWSLIITYLTPETKDDYKGSIEADRYGLR